MTEEKKHPISDAELQQLLDRAYGQMAALGIKVPPAARRSRSAGCPVGQHVVVETVNVETGKDELRCRGCAAKCCGEFLHKTQGCCLNRLAEGKRPAPRRRSLGLTFVLSGLTPEKEYRRPVPEEGADGWDWSDEELVFKPPYEGNPIKKGPDYMLRMQEFAKEFARSYAVGLSEDGWTQLSLEAVRINEKGQLLSEPVFLPIGIQPPGRDVPASGHKRTIEPKMVGRLPQQKKEPDPKPQRRKK